MNSAATARVDPRGSARRSPTAGNRGQGSKWLHPTTRRRIYERDRWRCVWCRCEVAQLGMRGVKGVSVEGVVFTDGLQLRQASIDHVVPRTRGGSNNSSNLITCCVACNAVRGDQSVPEFARHQACWSEPPAMVIVRRVRNAQRRKLPVLE
jgi:5-methylcytosine-specific restriction endonuclease McrA